MNNAARQEKKERKQGKEYVKERDKQSRGRDS